VRMKTTTRMTALLLLAAASGACRSKVEPTREDFTRGMQAYLGQRGDLCIGRPSWPIDIAEGTNLGSDALQLPVLERLGLVTSAMLPVRVGGEATPFNARRYRLTAAGRERYLDRATRRPLAPDEPGAAQHADFCVAKLALDRVESWEVQPAAAPTSAMVSYTYTVDAPPWAADPGFQKVFPAVSRVLRGAGTAQLVEGFSLRPEGWTANELVPKADAAPHAAPQAAAP
jgi:hypothetical protein